MFDHQSTTHKFFNPTTNSNNLSNSLRWINFKPWKANDLKETIGKFKITSLGKNRDALSEENILEPNTVSDDDG